MFKLLTKCYKYPFNKYTQIPIKTQVKYFFFKNKRSNEPLEIILNDLEVKMLLIKALNKEQKYIEVINYYHNNILYRYRADKRIKIHYNHASKQIKQQRVILEKYLTDVFPKVNLKRVLITGCICVFIGFLLFRKSSRTDKFKNVDEGEQMKSIKKKMSKFKMNMDNFDDNFDITFSKKMNVRLDDVRVYLKLRKGIDEVKEEIQELIRMMKFPKKYIDAGAKLHKGILLCGKPGTGKTLIARAIAGEAGINFIYLNGSDFDELFVGVGASRIRKLFKVAKNHKPCMIFIDEIDTLLAREGFEHSSSRATINQFLAELDGFSKIDEVFILGATNHEKDLDPAAIRPGRFDKTIHINVPDEKGRKDIINFYLDKIKLKKDTIEIPFIAKLTPGFTGAEIENLVNLATISAVSSNLDFISHDHFTEARDRVLMGIKRTKINVPNKRRYKTALHESGHTLVCYKNDICKKNLEKVTIVSRGNAEGVTFRLFDENQLGSKREFLCDIDVAMGGHVAEELIYGPNNVSAGCSSDLDKATRVAQNMIKKFGMYGDKVGYAFISDEGYSWEDDNTSDKYKTEIDSLVKMILNESHDRVYKLLKDNANDLKSLAQKVFEYDTLNYEEICNVLEGKPELIKKNLVRPSYDEKKDEEENKSQ